jgi:hypothetical protein
MPYPVYPSILPCFNAENYSYGQANTITRTEFASGRTRHRRRFKDVPVTFELSVTMTTAELGVWESWRYNELQDIGWFTATLKTGNGVEPWDVRLISKDSRPKYKGGGLWELSYTAEARQQRYMPAGDLADFIEAGSLTFGDQTAAAVASISTSLGLYYTGYIQ